jgi:hypothetical protein
MFPFQIIVKKIFYGLAVISLVYPGGVALINLLKEGYNPYWIQFLLPTVAFLVIGKFIPSANNIGK